MTDLSGPFFICASCSAKVPVMLPGGFVRCADCARKSRPTIVCLCGSGRFKEAFDRAEFEETLAGKIVLTIGCNTHDVARTADLAKHKPALDMLHLQKIDLADEVLILNVGGYVGESTGRELRYATEQRKSVRFLEPVDADRFADLLRRR